MPYDDKKRKGASAAGAGARKVTPKNQMTKTPLSNRTKGKVTELPEVTVTAKRPSGPTAEQRTAATDWQKKARAVNAQAGMPVAAKGTTMRSQQDAYAKSKQGTSASSVNREQRITKMAEEMEREAMSNKTILKLKKP